MKQSEIINIKIAETLGIEPTKTTTDLPAKVDVEPLPVPAEKTKLEILRDKPLEEVIIDEDFNDARDNLKDIIEKTNDAITKLSMIAEESESPRAFEVLEKLLRQATDANDKLLNLSKQRKELTKGLPIQQKPRGHEDSNQPPVVHQNIENAVFVGNSTDLDKMLSERRNKQKEQNVQLPTGTVQDQE